MHSIAPFPLIAPDLQAGTDFISRLPLANPTAAQEQINQFLDNLLAAPPDLDDLLTFLERLRGPMAFVEEEMARRYHNKPLVLAEMEEQGFQQVLATWSKLRRAYGHCLEGALLQTADPAFKARLAVILHRLIHCTGVLILEHFRARRELPAGIWSELHRHYQMAEELQVATAPVEDRTEGEGAVSNCAAAYVAVLLVDMGSPYSQSVRDINLMRRWATLWAPLVSVHRLEESMPAYLLEFSKDAGMHPASKEKAPAPDMRCLDTSRLARQMSRSLDQLRLKIPPAQLGLGEETASHAAKILEQLTRPWSQAAMARKFRRFAAEGAARVCIGFEAMHFAVTGQPFEQPETARTYYRGDFDALFTFREKTRPGHRPAIRAQDEYPVDDWTVINHSATGFRLARTSAGQKMAHGQLLALCPHDGDRFLLAQSSWLMQEREGGVVAGVSVLPGIPTGVAVRLVEEGKGTQGFFLRAFLLSPVPSIAETGSIVLPLGTYQASRVFDVNSPEGLRQIRLKNILQRGADFERISFETV